MSSLAADASIISNALFSAWSTLDARLSLPLLIVRQIDAQRAHDSETRPIRDFYKEICYESLLLRGAWNLNDRETLSKAHRSTYLDCLFKLRSNFEGELAKKNITFDPAYSRWARLKYGDTDPADIATWRRYLAEARQAAVEDCLAAQESSFGALSSLSPRKVKSTLVSSFDQQSLTVEVVRLAESGFAARVPLGFRQYYIECQMRDISLLRRRIVPFAFEIASKASDENLRMPSTDIEIWPGALDYRYACKEREVLSGVCSIFAIFVRALQVALLKDIAENDSNSN